MEFKEALKEILKIKGSSALEDESTLKLLEDYSAFEEYPVFNSIMSNIIVMKIGKMLQNTFYYSVEDNGHAWGQMKDQLLEGLPCDKIFVDLFLDAIEYAFTGYAYEKGASERNFNSEVEEMLGQVWTDNKGCKYSSDKEKLINGSEVEGAYIVNPETKYIDPYAFQQNSRIERITFPKKLDKIGSHAFQNCSFLNTVDFKDDVSEICECAFGGCASIKEVYLPNGLHKISDGLFSVCTNLLYVHFPQSLTHIGANAFSDCLSLQYIVIPDNVTSIGDFAFKWCKSLYYVVLPSKLSSIGDGVFDNCQKLRYIGIPEGTKSKYTNLMPRYANLFIEYNKNEIENQNIVKKESLGSYYGKESVMEDMLKYNSTKEEVIGFCKGIQGAVVIPDGIQRIGKDAFENCNEITSIYIPDSVDYIGYGAFAGCYNLISVHLPSNLRCIEDSTFNDCRSLKAVNVPPNIERIGHSAFGMCQELKTFLFPESLRIIDSDAFIGCTFESIVLPKGVEELRDFCFCNCHELKRVIIPNTIKSIGARAFSGCENIEEIEIPNSVTEIGTCAFQGCRSLESIEIPNSVSSIGCGAFACCTNLKQIVVSQNNPHFSSINGVLFDKGINKLLQYPIGKGAESYKIPDSIIQIDSYAFAQDALRTEATFVKSVSFPSGLKEIGKEAFMNSKIESVELPDSVTKIGESCFVRCYNMKYLKLSNSLESIPNYAFMDCTKIASLSIPPSVKYIGKSAFLDIYALDIVVIPDTVRTIGASAFGGSTSFKEIHIRYGNPDDIKDNPFGEKHKKECDLFVPIGTKYAYSNHPFFKDYRNIFTEDY